MIIITNN